MAILTDSNQISLYQMRSQLSALGLEIRGIRFSKGSVSSIIKQTYNLQKRNKKDIYREFHALILKREKELGIPQRPLNASEKEILGM